MRQRAVAILAALVLVALVSDAAFGLARSPFSAFVKRRGDDRQPGDNSGPQGLGSSSSSSSMAPENEYTYTEQSVDHFDSSNTAVWAQRYYVNSTFFNGTGPVFFCVGGETPIGPLTALNGDFHCGWAFQLARFYSGLFVALEHRYYGRSFPTSGPDGLSVHNLKYLSSQQALSDIAQFQQFLIGKLSLQPSNVWLSFGGSYPGMLAAWSRLKTPGASIFASVASSAPVQAVVNYYGYFDVSHVALEYPWHSVGGSPACAEALQTAFTELGLAMQDPSQQASIEQAFDVCPNANLSDSANWVVFVEALSGIIDVQGNDPACTAPGCNIASVCAIMLNQTGSPLSKLVNLNAIVSGSSGCMDISAADAMAGLLNTSSVAPSLGRAWTWQCCNEFAFWQTCDPDSYCLFTTDPFVVNVSSYMAACESVFGISASSVTKAVATTNAYYGGWHPVGSRVLWVNGAVDPWHALSVLTAPANQAVLWVPGSSHHFWTHPPLPTDQSTVIEARIQIFATVAAWLAEAEAQYGVEYPHMDPAWIPSAAAGKEPACCTA